MTYILYVLKGNDQTCDESDYLPSGLNSFLKESYQGSEAAQKLGNRLFSIVEKGSSVSMIKILSTSLGNEKKEKPDEYERKTTRNRENTK